MTAKDNGNLKSDNKDNLTGIHRAKHADERLAHIVRLLSRNFRRSLEYRLSEHKISFGHWIFLRILWDEDGLSQKELSRRAGLMEPTVHSAITKMENLDLVEKRAPNPEKRRQLVYLTNKGSELRENLIPLAEETNRVAVDGINEKELVAMRRQLLKMIDNLNADEQLLVQQGLSIEPTRGKS